MAGSILNKEQAVLALTTAGPLLTTGSAGLVGTLDARAGGNAPDMFTALFSLLVQWATVTGIVANTVVADLYLVPAIDGTNYPDIDTTPGASNIPYTMQAGSFIAPKAPAANTNALFQSATVDLMPALYNVYIINRSGQTISVNWALKVLAAAAQYT
jgi:hypothetical protein